MKSSSGFVSAEVSIFVMGSLLSLINHRILSPVSLEPERCSGQPWKKISRSGGYNKVTSQLNSFFALTLQVSFSCWTYSVDNLDSQR